jgi:hypothetical protein
MSNENSSNTLWRVLGAILILAFAAVGTLQLGQPSKFVDATGLLFVLVAGVALVMISFPGNEIRRAFQQAAGAPGCEADLKASALFWEAAGRGFWIVGVLGGVLNLKIGFAALATEQSGGMKLIMNTMAGSLLATSYGVLLGVICLIPSWKLSGKLKDLPLARAAEPGSISVGRSGRTVGAVIGYLLFFLVLAALLVLKGNNVLMPSLLWMGYRPAMLVVLGGTIALMLFMGKANAGLRLSTAFAAMGLLGSLMGCTQLLFGMTISGPQGIAHVAGALAFVLSSCLTALLGMALLGAPLQDRAVRTGQVLSPSVFSRVSWYVFPLLSLMFLVLVFVVLITPLTGPQASGPQ